MSTASVSNDDITNLIIEELQSGGVVAAAEMMESLSFSDDTDPELTPGGMTSEHNGKPVMNVTVYSMADGSPSVVKHYMLPAVMKKKMEDHSGRAAFTLDKRKAPVFTPGTLKCFLHPEHELRAEYDAAGLVGRSCSKGNLRSEIDVQTHARVYHKREWEMWTEHEERERREADRAYQRETLEWMRRQMAPEAVEFACDHCGKTYASEHAVKSHIGKDHKNDQ